MIDTLANIALWIMGMYVVSMLIALWLTRNDGG